MNIWPFKRTPKNWELIDKTVLPSAYEQLVAAKQTLKRACGYAYFSKTVIYTFKDSISGKIRQERFYS